MIDPIYDQVPGKLVNTLFHKTSHSFAVDAPIDSALWRARIVPFWSKTTAAAAVAIAWYMLKV